MNSILSVDRLYKAFGTTSILDNVSFDLEKGECIALLGPSGCGKTTTLRCIAGLETITSGGIYLAGRQLSGTRTFVPPQDRGMGMVFQSYSIWPHLTVFENVAFGLKLKKLPKTEIERRVQQSLELVEIANLSNRRSAQLSGGQLQRVALARTLAVEPNLVLFDEPLSNLDAKLRGYMRGELRSLLKRLGMSAVYVTHDQTEASVVADRTAIMNHGRIEQIGSWEDLFFRPTTRFVAEFMGSGNVLAAEAGTLDECGLGVQLKSGLIIKVANVQDVKLDKNRAVEIYVPREAVTLTSVDTGDFNGCLQAVYPGPDVYEVHIASELGLLRASILATCELPSVGEHVGVSLGRSYVHLLTRPVFKVVEDMPNKTVLTE